MSRLRTAAATHTGYLRTTNQDLALATNDLAAVADGMGGHLGGEVAARIAVEQLLEAYRRNRTTDGLIAAVRAANEAVYSRGRSDRNLRGMGTTLTAAAVVGDEPDGKLRLALVNVGDSRGYLLDRPASAVPQADRGPQRRRGDGPKRRADLRRGGGPPAPAHLDAGARRSSRASSPTAGSSTSSPGAACCSAATGSRTSSTNRRSPRCCSTRPTSTTAASELVRSALQRGGTDNVTVVVVDVAGR